MEKNKFLTKIENAAIKIEQNVYVRAISKGMMQTIPALILGAFMTLLKAIPFEAWQNIVTNTPVGIVIEAITICTNGILAIWVLLGVSNRMAKYFDKDIFATMLTSLISFLILIPAVKLEEGTFINSQWIGTLGVFTAIVVAILASRLYILMMDKGVYIRMPKGVPPFVEKSFANIIPMIIVAIGSGILMAIFSLTNFESFPNLIYTILQIPLQTLGGSFGGVILAFVFISLFWWMGIHGKMIVYGAAFGAIFSINGVENAEAVAQTGTGIHAFDMGSVRIFFEHGGAGCILALVVLMTLFAKSERYKSLGKAFIVPTFFGISEPVIFGTPIVLNFNFLIPMILAPVVSGAIGFLALKLGFIPYPGGITVPTGTPFLLDGFLIGGTSYLIIQIICFIASLLIWYPFFKQADKIALKEETEKKNIKVQ